MALTILVGGIALAVCAMLVSTLDQRLRQRSVMANLGIDGSPIAGGILGGCALGLLWSAAAAPMETLGAPGVWECFYLGGGVIGGVLGTLSAVLKKVSYVFA